MASHRTLVLLESPIRKLVREMAEREGISISSVCRDLIREALEIVEDRYWDKAASLREKGFHWGKGLSHHQVWHSKKK